MYPQFNAFFHAFGNSQQFDPVTEFFGDRRWGTVGGRTEGRGPPWEDTGTGTFSPDTWIPHDAADPAKMVAGWAGSIASVRVVELPGERTLLQESPALVVLKTAPAPPA